MAITVPTATDMGLGQMRQTGVGSTPTQSFSTSADMFGAAQAQRSQQVGSILTAEAQKMIRADDERAGMEIEQEIRDWNFEATQGEDGVYRKRGSGAIGSTKAIQENYAKFSSKLLQGRVVSSATRRRIEAYIGQKGSSIEKEVGRYEQQQKAVYDNGLREARIQGSKEDAITYYNDPQKLAESETRIRSTMKRSAEANGWSPEETAQQIESEVSSMHKGVIDRMLTNKLGSDAAEYLEKNRKEIDGKDIAAIERAVSGGVVSQAAQNETDRIMNLDLTQTEALVMARADYTGKERDEIVKRLKVRYGEEASLAAAETKALQKSGWEKISKGGDPYDLSPTELAAAGRQVDSMWTMAKNHAQRGKGFSLTSETGVVQDFIGKDVKERAEADILPLQAVTTEADWNKIKKSNLDAQREITELETDPTKGLKIGKLVNKYAPPAWGVSSSGGFTAKTSETERALINAITGHLGKFSEDYVNDKGKQPPPGVLELEASQIMMSITKDKGIFFFEESTIIGLEGDTPISQIDFDEGQLSVHTKIPQDVLDEMLSQWPAGSVEPTMNLLRKYYKRGPVNAR